jgi:hypothetical protein
MVTLPEPVARSQGATRETDHAMVGRRRFLLLGIGGGAAALIGGSTLKAAADSPAVVQVWRLSADWGYAVPPKSRTRCTCQACRNHAGNKVFASKAVAIANRIHPCCVCQPYSIDLLAADVATLFVGSPSGDSIDLRDPDARGRFEAAMVRSLAPVPDPVVAAQAVVPAAPAAARMPDPEPTISVDAESPASSPTAAAEAPRATLPVTGGDSEVLLTAAAVLVVAGVVAVAGAATGDSAD